MAKAYEVDAKRVDKEGRHRGDTKVTLFRNAKGVFITIREGKVDRKVFITAKDFDWIMAQFSGD